MESRFVPVLQQKIIDAQAAPLPQLTHRDVWLPAAPGKALAVIGASRRKNQPARSRSGFFGLHTRWPAVAGAGVPRPERPANPGPRTARTAGCATRTPPGPLPADCAAYASGTGLAPLHRAAQGGSLAVG